MQSRAVLSEFILRTVLQERRELKLQSEHDQHIHYIISCNAAFVLMTGPWWLDIQLTNLCGSEKKAKGETGTQKGLKMEAMRCAQQKHGGKTARVKASRRVITSDRTVLPVRTTNASSHLTHLRHPVLHD